MVVFERTYIWETQSRRKRFGDVVHECTIPFVRFVFVVEACGQQPNQTLDFR